MEMKKGIACLITLALLALLALPVGAVEKPLSLSESIDLALHNNLNLQSSQKSIEIARSDVKIADAAKKPNLALTSSYTKLGGDNLGNNSKDSYGTKLGFSYPLYLYSGGKLESAVRARNYNLKSSEFSYKASEQQLVYNVKEAYYNVLKSQEMVKVAEENLAGMQSHLKVAQAMFKTGMAPKFDVLKAEVGVLQAKQSLIEAKNKVNLAKASFNNVLNRDLEASVNLVNIMETTAPMDKLSLSQLVEKAYAQRPELIQLDASLKSAEENVKYAKGDKKPNLVLTGEYGLKDDKFFPQDKSWSVTLSSTFNIWDGGVIDNQVKQAEYKRDQAQLQLENTKQSIALDVRKAYLNIQEAKEALETAKKTVEQAKEGLKIAEVRYKAGMGTSVERLDAQVDLTQAETSHVQALHNYNLARAQLEKALGEERK